MTALSTLYVAMALCCLSSAACAFDLGVSSLELPEAAQWRELAGRVVVAPYVFNRSSHVVSDQMMQNIVARVGAATAGDGQETSVARAALAGLGQHKRYLESLPKASETDCRILADIIAPLRLLAAIELSDAGRGNVAINVLILDVITCKSHGAPIVGRLYMPQVEIGFERTTVGEKGVITALVGKPFLEYFASGVFFGFASASRNAEVQTIYFRYGTYARAELPFGKTTKAYATGAYGVATANSNQRGECTDARQSNDKTCDYKTIAKESYKLIELRAGISWEFLEGKTLNCDIGSGLGRDFKQDVFASVRRNSPIVTLGLYFY